MNTNTKELSYLKSQLAILSGLLILAWLFDWQKYLVPVATILGVLFLFLPKVGEWISIGWMKLALFLGHWNGRILLSIIFYVFLTPIALLFRLFGNQKNVTDADSNYLSRDHRYNATDLKNLW